MDLRWLLLSVVLALLCPHTPSGEMTALSSCRSGAALRMKPLVDVPNLVRSYPSNMHRFTNVVDYVLGIALDMVSVHGQDRVSIPDVEKSLLLTEHGFSYETTFRGRYGWLEKLSTLTRVGEVVTSKYRRDAVSVTTALTFKSLTVGFEKYTLPLGLLTQLSGNIRIKINDNRVVVKTLVTVDDKAKDTCSFTLEDLKIERMGGFRATITGLYPFNWLLQFITNAILKGQRAVVRGELEAQFRMEARKFLHTMPCGKVC